VIDCVVAPVDHRFPLRADEVRVIVVPAQNELGPLIVGVDGRGLTVTGCAAEVAEQPFASVTVTLYEPAADTVIDCVVAPVDQTLPVNAEDVRVIVLPAQNELGPVIVGVTGSGSEVTTCATEVAEQPFASVTVTLYDPAAETVIDCVIAPVDQRFPVNAEDVSVIVLPAQNALGPLIVGVAGRGFEVTACAAEVAEQPFASVTVTLYVPPAETVIDCVVAPVDQRFPVNAEDVSVIVLPAQNELGPLIVAVAGSGFEVTTLATEVAEQPFASATVTL
jgi:hypothetical protein